MNHTRLALPLVALLACAKQPDAEPPPDLAVLPDLRAPADLTQPADLAPAGCPRLPAAADRARKVVVTHPYDDAGKEAATAEVLTLTADGTLRPGAARFQLGTAMSGEIVFTPDGEVGMVALKDGTVGVFRLPAGDAAPQVVHMGYKDSGYATSLVVDPAGDRVYVLSDQWRDAGGGIATARIGCDGSLQPEGKVAPAKLPAAMAFLPGNPTRAVVAAADVLDSPQDQQRSAHLIDMKTRAVLGSADVFGDDNAIVSTLALTPDGRYALVADNSEFSGIPNRLAVAAVEASALRPVQVLTKLNDPVALALSPFGNGGLIVSGYGNGVVRFSYDPAQPMAPIKIVGEPSYTGKRPQLPANAVVIGRGSLKGRVLLAENVGVRQLSFLEDGGVKDLGLVGTGAGLSSIVGAIGIQP